VPFYDYQTRVSARSLGAHAGARRTKACYFFERESV
jgi:hypothetical protein